jgi:hypothetical protein
MIILRHNVCTHSSYIKPLSNRYNPSRIQDRKTALTPPLLLPDPTLSVPIIIDYVPYVPVYVVCDLVLDVCYSLFKLMQKYKFESAEFKPELAGSN